MTVASELIGFRKAVHMLPFRKTVQFEEEKKPNKTKYKECLINNSCVSLSKFFPTFSIQLDSVQKVLCTNFLDLFFVWCESG